MRMRVVYAATVAAFVACGQDRGSEDDAAAGDASGSGSTDGSSGGGDGDGDADADSETGNPEPKLDVGPGDGDGDGDGDPCKVDPDGMDAAKPCEMTAPPDSFEPEVQWSWSPNALADSTITPLVANLSDDDDDGDIDLCDTPDVLALTANWAAPWSEGRLHVLDGDDGTELLEIPTPVHPTVTPAIGDLDGDGRPEIVASLWQQGGNYNAGPAVAFEDDGTVAWTSMVVVPPINAVALADLDADGDVEVVFANVVLDHEGNLEWQSGQPTPYAQVVATAAADLDEDGAQEVIVGRDAYRADGTLYYDTGLADGSPAIADLDEDGRPEVLLTYPDGIAILEDDGTIKLSGEKPLPVAGQNVWNRPAALHAISGPGVTEFAMSSQAFYSVFRLEQDAIEVVWSADVLDQSGLASGTAFDFLGDATAEAMYGDEAKAFVFGDGGQVLLEVVRASRTQIEYPTVADVDNDGHAEFVVTAEHASGWGGGNEQAPTVQVIKDSSDQWVPARRIWNQHTYHVTNVREDSTIPQDEVPHWTLLNTFRTQAQSEAGGICQPPEG